MKKRISLFTFVLSVFTFIGLSACKTSFNTEVKTPDNTGDRTSIVINEVFDLEEGDPEAFGGAGRYVKITMSNLSAYVKDARTIIPDNPELYWSVVASTDSYAAGTVTTAGTDIEDDADCSLATATANGKLVVRPWYPTTANQMSKIVLTLKVGKAYYFTTYATDSSPAAISKTLFGNKDVTSDTIYTQVYNDAQTINTAENYYDNQANLIEALADNAVVKGTNQFYIGEGNGNVAIYEGADASSGVVTTIKINAGSSKITGTGRALIPVNLAATTTLADDNLQVKYLVLRCTPVGGGTPVELNVDVNGAALNVALYPVLNVGTYDTDLIFFNEAKDDIFTIHDTLVVWKNQVSLLYGSGTYYTKNVAEWTGGTYVGDPSTLGTPAVSTITGNTAYLQGSAVSSTMTTPALATTNKITNSVIGYTVTAAQIKNAFRTVFYVAGSGNIITVKDTEDGSYFRPFNTIQEALDAITTGARSRTNNYGSATTDWNIVVDGTVAGDISYTNTVDETFNLTIRKLATAAVGLSGDITLVNETADNSVSPWNLWLKDVTWTGTDKTFNVGVNAFLANTVLDTAATNTILLYKNHATYQDGIFYALTSDATSVAKNITNTNGTNAVITDAVVLRYDYHEPNETYTTTPPQTYMSVDPSARFILKEAYAQGDAGYDAVNGGYERVLEVDRQVGSSNYGCFIIQIEASNIAVLFKDNVLRASIDSWAPNPATFTATQVANGLATVTVSILVESENSDIYPANGNAVLDALKLEANSGYLVPVLKVDSDESEATLGTDFTVVEATGTEAGSSVTSATYNITVTLATNLSYAVGQGIAQEDLTFSLHMKPSADTPYDFENTVVISITE